MNKPQHRLLGAGTLVLLAVALSLPLAITQAGSGPIYARQVQLHPSSEPWGIVATDLDDDGNLDIVAATYLIDEVAVFFGNGDGTLQPPVHYPVDGGPHYLALGDFNEDGREDVAVTHDPYNAEVAAFSILIGKADGTFETPTSHGFGDTWAVIVGDFNEDDHQDLIVSHDSGPRLFPGNGDGTFAPEISIPGAGPARTLVVGDFNGDGHDDFAGPNKVMLGNGDLTFSAEPTLVTGEFWHMATADLDDDSIPDLVLTGLDDGGVVLIGNGDGSFEQSHTWLTSSMLHVVVMDQNEDGAPDLVVTTVFDLLVLHGNGDGQFADPVEFPAGNWLCDSMVVGDFDNDGRDDLGMPSRFYHHVGVILRDDDGAFDLPSYDGGGGEGRYDLNGDGRNDLLALDGGNPVSARLATGAGTFARSISSPDCETHGDHGDGFDFYAVGEFTGDGVPDLAVISESQIVVFCEGDGTGLFVPVGFEILGAEHIWDLGAADLDGDGIDDVMAAYYTGVDHFLISILSSGMPPFGWPKILFTGNLPSFGLAHIDGDEHVDLVLNDRGAGVATVRLGNGNGTFGPPSAPIPGALEAVGDVNGDSVPDLVTGPAVSYLPQRSQLIIGNGDGTFTPGPIVPGIVGVHSIADVDLDGIVDLAGKATSCATRPTCRSCIVFGTGNGDFAQCEHFAIGRVASDFDLDGRIDMIEPGITPVFNKSGPDSPTFEADRQTLVWPAELGAWTYTVYSGPLSDLVDLDDDGLPDGGYGSCISGNDDDPRDTFLLDTQYPGPGEGFFYLIGVVDAQGEHGLGTTSSGLPRVPAAPCP